MNAADSHLSVPPNNLTAREAVLRLRGSKIREVANTSLGRSDVLAFWFGEPDEQTPQFIRRAGMASLEAGETFYTHNFGLIELRTALANYISALGFGNTSARYDRYWCGDGEGSSHFHGNGRFQYFNFVDSYRGSTL